ncbi:MAG: helix-turn-helix transcriptional regulator [Alphaproteobacteria bacterium]|nr:helix-turn-helix transcriptional regulator [Alphaproteobacteria bacterium]
MISHDDIWRGIDRLATAHGYSPSGLAKKAGLDPTTFNKSKRHSPDGKPRWPSTESLAKVLAVTGATMSEFVAFIDGVAESAPPPSSAMYRLPVIGFAQAGRAGYFDEDGYPSGQGWDEVDFPVRYTGKDSCIYALEVSGDSMEPLYRAGDLLIVSPDAGVRRGDRVVVKTKGGEVMAKELSRQTASRLDLKSLNPAHETITLPADKVVWMVRVLWVSQ